MDNFNEVINGDRPILVDFYATWCNPCRMMHPILEELKKEIGEKAIIIKVDIDKNRPLAALYNISSVPTLMLFRHGEILWRKSGVTPANELETVINSHM